MGWEQLKNTGKKEEFEWMHEQSEFILMGHDTIVGFFTSLL